MIKVKDYLVKVLFALVTFLSINIIFITEAKAENLQVLPNAESGWTRYDDTNKLIKYYGKFLDDDTYEDDWSTYTGESGCYNGTATWSTMTGANVRFIVNGEKFRVIGLAQQLISDYHSFNNHDVYIDGKHDDAMVLKYSKSGDVNKVVLYEYTFEKPGVHTVDIVIDNTYNLAPMDVLSIDAIDVVGTLQEKAAIVEEPVLVIEEPKNYYYFSFDYDNKNHSGPQNVNLNELRISGYALNGSGISSVTATIDDKTVLNASIGLERNDEETLKSKHPGYSNYNKCGYSVKYDLNNLTLGIHKAKIKAAGKDGKTTEKVIYFRVLKDDKGGRYTRNIHNTVPFYRYVNISNDHFYTIAPEKMPDGCGYSVENNGNPIGYAYAYKEENTVPLYRYFNESKMDHFYTIDFNELGNGNSQYVYEGIECYVYTSNVKGTNPVYRYYNGTLIDHMYTVGKGELGNGAVGYVIENNGNPIFYLKSK